MLDLIPWRACNILKILKILKIFVLTLGILLTLAFMLLYQGDIPKDVVNARYSSPASQFLNLGDTGLIHYPDEGNHRAIPVVLIHGSNASLHTYEPWVERLQDDYRIISLDLPGHGLTGEVPSNDYSIDAFVKTIDGVMDHLGIEQFVLAGNSMGGRATWGYALKHPEKIVGMVIIGSGGPESWYGDQPRANSVWVFNLLGSPWFRKIAAQLDPYYVTVQGLKAAYNNSPIIDDALISRYYDMKLREGSRRATITRAGLKRSQEEFDLSQLTMPALIMWGREDTLVPFSIAERFEQELPNTTTAYYEDVGHIPMEEIPAASAKDIAKFLDSLGR